MKTCVMCGGELATPLDEFGDREHPVCREHWLEYGSDGGGVNGVSELLLLPIEARIKSYEAYLEVKREALLQPQREIAALEEEIRDMQAEIDYAEERLEKLKNQKRKKEAEADGMVSVAAELSE